MRLKKEVIAHNLGGQHIIFFKDKYASGYQQVIRCNNTAAYIINCLKQECTLDSIIESLKEKFDVPKDQVRNDVIYILNYLRSIDAIEEKL